MNDTDFPSGPWIGFYVYSGCHQDRHRMDLSLSFGNGLITGEGNDDIGPFVIKGRYDTRSKECHWTKTYVGAHDVFYRGVREGKGIWGTWEIGDSSHGGFRIWPLAHGSDRDTGEEQDQLQPCETTADEPVAV